MDVLVTGGTGFIGSNLLRRLSNDSSINLFYTTGSSEDLVGIARNIGRNLDGLDWSRAKKIDVLFHQAGCLDSNNSNILKINVDGSYNLFENAVRKGCKNIVYASTVGVYGISKAPFIEGRTKLNPVNEYAKSKLELERMAKEFSKQNKGVNLVGLRYSNVYGPGENNRNTSFSLIKKFSEDIFSGKEIVVFGDGSMRRDFVYINDVVWANILASKLNRSGVYNIGFGESWSFREVAGVIGNVLKKESRIIPNFDVDLSNFPEDTKCDLTKSMKQLSYKPLFDLERGVTEYFRSGELI